MDNESKVTKSRKIEHVNIVLTQDVQYKRITSMFNDVELVPTGKDVDPNAVDTKSTFLEREISAPFFVSGMTGGDEHVGKINYDIAAAVSELRLPMGVGSQRAMIEDKAMAKTYAVKSESTNFDILNMNSAPLLFIITSWCFSSTSWSSRVSDSPL